MKREFLKNLDLGDGAKLSDAAIDAIMAEHGKDKTALEGTITTLQGQLGDANEKLEGFDPNWKDTVAAERKKLEKQQFDFALEKAVSSAKPRNTKAVLALLDREKLNFAGGEVVGLEKQLDAMKKGEETAFLFEEAKPSRTGLSHQNNREVGGDGKKEAANDALRALFGGAD